MQVAWKLFAGLALGALALGALSSFRPAPSAEAAPGVQPGARVLLLRGSIEEVFVVRAVQGSHARLELDLDWARDEERRPLLTGLLERGESALERIDRDEVEGLLARLRRAKAGVEGEAQRSAEERVAVTAKNPLWVNFAAVERYLVLAPKPASPQPQERR